MSEHILDGSAKFDISVVVPTFNRKESIRTVLEALGDQTLAPDRFEVIIVSDGSTDGTVDLIRGLQNRVRRLRVLDLPNRGPAAARNSGARAARGRYLAFTDDDCVPAKDWLEQLVGAFERTGAAAVQGRTTTDRSTKTPLTHQIEIGRPWLSSMSTCNAGYDKHVFDRVEGFDAAFRFAHNEDRDLVWRVEELGPVVFAPEAHIVHPPRPDRFWRIARRVKVFESDFLLYYKNPAKYRKYVSPSPWFTIYWLVFVVQQLGELKSNCRYLIKSFRPLQFFTGLALVFARWFYLLRFFPTYLKARIFYQSPASQIQSKEVTPPKQTGVAEAK